METFRYVNWHNNYDELKLGQIYEGYIYSDEWIKINSRLFRRNCFERTNECFCNLKKGDLFYGKMEGDIFELIKTDDVEYCCEDYTWRLETDKEVFYLTENDMKSDLISGHCCDIEFWLSITKEKLLNV